MPNATTMVSRLEKAVLSQQSLYILSKSWHEDLAVVDGFRELSQKSLSWSTDAAPKVRVPELLNSMETLLFLGFKWQRAQEIFDQYGTVLAAVDVDLFQHLSAHITTRHDDGGGGGGGGGDAARPMPPAKYRAYLSKIGLTPDTCTQMSDPRLEMYKDSVPPARFVLTYLETKWESLKDINLFVLPRTPVEVQYKFA